MGDDLTPRLRSGQALWPPLRKTEREEGHNSVVLLRNTPSGASLDFARDKSDLVPLGKGDRKDRADTEVCLYKDDLTPDPFPIREGEGRMQCAPTKTKHKSGQAPLDCARGKQDLPLQRQRKIR